MDIRDDIGAWGAVSQRVYDKDVGDLLLDGVSQRVPSPGWDKGVLRSEDDCELRVKLAGEVSDDVHE